MADAAEKLVERVPAVEEGEHRPAAGSQLPAQGEQAGMVGIDLQAVQHGADGARALAGQQAGTGEIEVVVRLVELHLHRVAAELKPLAHPLLAQGDAVAEIGVEEARQTGVALLGDLPEVAQALVPVPSPAAVDSPPQRVEQLRAYSHPKKFLQG